MKKILIAAVASATLMGTANAATVVSNVYFGSAPNQTTTTGDVSTDFSRTGTFQLFDSSLGTLTGVKIITSYSITTTLTATAGASADTTITKLSTDSAIGAKSTNSAIQTFLNTYYDNAGVAYNQQSQQVRYSVLDSATPFYTNQDDPDASYTSQDIAAGQTYNFGTLTTSGGSTRNYTVGGGSYNLNGFIGGSNSFADWIASTATGTTLSFVGGNATASQTTTGNASFQIIYTYTAAAAAVPEPATWAMMIAGFGLVGYGLRRRGMAPAFN